MKVRFGLAAALSAALLAVAAPHAHAASVPSGEVTFASNRVEPVYNSLDGSFGFLLTPQNAPAKASDGNVAEIYVVMYPAASANAIGPVICTHQPVDNCPDHGPALSGLAEATIPAVYGAGVWGHDHLAALPAAPRPSDDREFKIDWLPVVVLFKSPEAVTHVTTIDQLNQLRAANLVQEIALPGATFHGSPVSATVYANGIPVQPVPPTP